MTPRATARLTHAGAASYFRNNDNKFAIAKPWGDPLRITVEASHPTPGAAIAP